MSYPSQHGHYGHCVYLHHHLHLVDTSAAVAADDSPDAAGCTGHHGSNVGRIDCTELK